MSDSSTNKSRLRNFYSKKSSKNLNSSSNVIVDKFDKNKATFDSTAYFENLVQKKSLNDLMDEEAALIREVKQYDSDMQNLVMENYNKFIMATDTIGRMKVKFQEMESKVLKLSDDIRIINKSAKEIGSNLQPNREKLNKLVDVQSALSQLQFIFSLPKSLQEYIDQKHHTEAYNLYIESKPVLEKYRNHASFEKTVIHIDILIGKLQQRIYDDSIYVVFSQNSLKRDQAVLGDVSTAANQYINLKTSETVAIKDILELANQQLPVSQYCFKFSEDNEHILTELLEKFETIIIILSSIQKIKEPELTNFCKIFFNKVCNCIEQLDQSIFTVYMIRFVYQRLLEAGDSPNLPPAVNTQVLAERLAIIKVKQILNTFDLSLDYSFGEVGVDGSTGLGQLVSDPSQLQTYPEIRRLKVEHIITNLKDFSDLWSFGNHLPDDPILEMEYFKHGRFYENILEIIVIKPLKGILERKNFTQNYMDTTSNITNLKLSRFAHDLANSDLDTISDVANASLEVFTPWNGGIPELILKFKVYCRKQSTFILSNYILNCGDEALNFLDNSISDNEKPVYNLAWAEIFNLISRNVEEVVKYYPTSSSGKTASSLHTSVGKKSTHNTLGSHVSAAHGRPGGYIHSSERSGYETGSSIHSNDNSLPGNMTRLFTERVEVLPKIFSSCEGVTVGSDSTAARVGTGGSGTFGALQLPTSSLHSALPLSEQYLPDSAIETGRLATHVNLHQTQFDIFCVRDFIRRSFSRKDISEDNGLKQLLDDWLNSCMVRSEDPSLMEDSALEFLLHRNQ